MRRIRTLLFGNAASVLSAGLLLLVTGCSTSPNPVTGAGAPDGSLGTLDSGVAANDAATESDASDGEAAAATDASLGTEGDAGDGSPEMPSDGASGDASGDGSACPPPPALYPPLPDGGIYCPFSAADAGTQTCANGSQMCCLSLSASSGASACEPFGASCPAPGFGVWQCASPQDCAGAPIDGGGEPLVCCLLSGYAQATNAAGCPATFKVVGGFASVTCAAASQCVGTAQVPNPASDAGGSFTDYLTVVCEADADCVAAGAGSTCTPIKVSGVSIGLCTLNLR